MSLGCAGGNEETDTDVPSLPTTGMTEGETGSGSMSEGTSDGSDSQPNTAGTDETGGTDTSGALPCEMPQTWYEDADSDGFGNPFAPEIACDAPPGYVDNPSDCNDEDGAMYPGADEVCDGVDNNCDGQIDEAAGGNNCSDCELVAAGATTHAFCPTVSTFDDARAYCQSTFTGGDLVKIDDEAENASLVAADVATAGMSHWIGLSDTVTEGTFSWVVDGSPLAYTNWTAMEPNDAGGNEDCAEIGLAAGTWNDLPCTELRPFICEF